ncbi:MAG: efflux RND transporter periplasmic adaptor subunit, partial [Porphyromonadaceae bacterium]|nr:efflux RND transporter periplasmic adaptor subunit [Porphyromonadaceae bacterium]
VEATRILYNQIKSYVARMKKLYENKSLSGNDYEKAAAGLAQLGVQLKVNQNKLDYTRLTAPVSGYIQSVNFEEAEMVDAGTPLVTLLDTHRMEVTVDIPASLYTQREEIRQITCRSAFDTDSDRTMSLVSFTLKADGNQLYKMRLTFDTPPDNNLTPGMNVAVNLVLNKEGAEGYTLPLHALFQNSEEKSCVWVVKSDSTVVRRAVTVTGMDDAGNAVITEGLNGDETVVKAGVNALHDGEKIHVVTVSSSNVGGLL